MTELEMAQKRVIDLQNALMKIISIVTEIEKQNDRVRHFANKGTKGSKEIVLRLAKKGVVDWSNFAEAKNIIDGVIK